MKTKLVLPSLAYLVACLLLTVSPSSAPAAAPWAGPIMQPGIAALTCAAQQKNASGATVPPNLSFPFGLVDLRTPPLPKYTVQGTTAALWNPPMYHHPDWSAQRLGCVFGITIDSTGNIYVAAHSLFVPYWGAPFFGNPYLQFGTIGGSNPIQSSGTIYRIDALTGVVTVFVVLPQQADPNLPWNSAAGPGIGNLTYDEAHDQLFATNLEDGRIYRITKSGLVGTISGVFDPLAPDNGLPGMPPLGDRLWAIEASGGQLFYSVWNQGTASNPQVIRSVGILPGGALNPSSDIAVLTVTPTSAAAAGYLSTPVSDLSLSRDGLTMTLAERGMLRTTANGGSFTDYYVVANHYTPVKLAQYSGSSWSVVKTLASGKNSSLGEGYGGADFGPESGQPETLVWMSSADLAGSPGPHGIQGVRRTDFPAVLAQAVQAYAVPYDPGYTASGPDVKGIGADVEIMPEKACVQFVSGRVECQAGEVYSYSFCFTNRWTNTIYHIVSLGLPSGVSMSPGPILDFPSGIAPGQGICTNVTLTVGAAGVDVKELCFQLAFHTLDFSQCCIVPVCLQLPRCCLPPIGESKVDCDPATGVMSYTFAFQNNSGQAVGALYLLQLSPACFSISPASVSFVPPVPIGGVTNVTVSVIKTNLCPDQLCLKLLALNTNSTECCVMDRCVDLPKCGHSGELVHDGKRATLSFPEEARVEGVSFFLDGREFASDVVAPYEALFPSVVPTGLHELAALTRYSSGAWVPSDSRWVYLEGDTTGGTPEAPIISVAVSTAGIELTVGTMPLVKCYLEASEGLEPARWEVLEAITGDGTPRLVRVQAPVGKMRFFRVREE
ncbi:MAG: hypothetical protein JNN07_12290 [Verrucomicrobiales bacterium]|nr:hypothetical protein [Verrucomicrobiales bacterium]